MEETVVDNGSDAGAIISSVDSIILSCELAEPKLADSVTGLNM